MTRSTDATDGRATFIGAKLYAGRVTIRGRVLRRIGDHYRVRVESVESPEWPYPPRVGQTLIVKVSSATDDGR